MSGIYNEKLIAQLENVLSPAQVSVRESDRLCYGRDMWPLDTIRMQEGEVARTGAVVWPRNEGQVAEVMRFARREGVPVVPFGAGSGVVGGIVPTRGSITMDLKSMNRLASIDDHSLLADVEAGMVGEVFERELNRRGYTCGHFPSSMYCSTVGGWLAARGAGQLSSKYGKAEDRALSIRAVLADGRVIETPVAPRSATGPDWLQAVVGSEGTYAVITKVKWKISPYPEHREFHAFHFPTLASGLDAVRCMFQGGLKPAVCRLYDPVDTLFASSGKSAVTEKAREGSLASRLVEALRRPFPDWPRVLIPRLVRRPAPVNSIIRKRARKSRLVLMFEGPKALARIEHRRAVEVCMSNRADDLGPEPARRWLNHRYAVSYGLSTVFDLGLFADTMEVATRWSNLEALYNDIMDAIGRHAFVMAHFSHAYTQGCSIYFTFASAGVSLTDRQERYRRIWDDAMDACIRRGASISHHHGVGILKQNYILREHGEAFKVIRALKQAFDPAGILNPGKMGL